MIIYLITNLVNGKVYVGQTTRSLEVRWKGHCSGATRGWNYPICKAIRKYGPESFSIKNLATCETQEWSDYLEKVWILLYDSRNRTKGYNVRSGGDTSPMAESTRKQLSELSKRAWSEGRLKGYPHTQETKDKISKIQREGMFSKHPVTSEELVFLWNNGVSALVLSKHFSLTRTTIYERIKKSGLEYREINSFKNRSKDNHPRNIPLNMEEILRLRNQGFSFEKIASQLGAGTGATIRRRVIKYKETYQ